MVNFFPFWFGLVFEYPTIFIWWVIDTFTVEHKIITRFKWSNNWSISLEFFHHVFLIRFTIRSSNEFKVCNTISFSEFTSITFFTFSSSLSFILVTGFWNKFVLTSKFVNEIRITTVTTLIVYTTINNMLDWKSNIIVFFDLQSSLKHLKSSKDVTTSAIFLLSVGVKLFFPTEMLW